MPKKSRSNQQSKPPAPPPLTAPTSTANINTSNPADAQPTSTLTPQIQTAEWRAKNAQAKELIMSTLVPGSEPHTIAKNLDSASEIWKALEQKYGPVTSSSLSSLPSTRATTNATSDTKKDVKRREMDNNDNKDGSNSVGKGDTAKRIQELGSLINEKIALFKSVTKGNEKLEAELARETDAQVKLKGGKGGSSELQKQQEQVSKHYRTERDSVADTQAKVEELEFLVNDAEVAVRREAQARAKKEFFASMPNRDQRFLWALLHGGKPETTAWFNGTNVTP